MTDDQLIDGIIDLIVYKPGHPDKPMFLRDRAVKVVEAFRAELDKWIPIESSLPDHDEYVLWYHQSGKIIQEAIDKDWDKEYLNYFLSGYGEKELSGPVTHWKREHGPNAPIVITSMSQLMG